MTKYKAFISFRKIHPTNAELVKNTLIEQYGFLGGEIFLDKHNIGPEQFDKKLEEAVKSSSCLILIVTKGCFVPKEDEDDWFLREIKTAITNNVTIIPVLFDDIKSLSTDPVTIEALKRLEGEYFTAEEIKVLQNSQSIHYDYDLSETTFSKLNEFIEKAQDKCGNSTILSKIKLGVITIFCIVLFFAIAFVFFLGLGFIWGLLTSSRSQEKIIQDNTRIEGSTAIFSFGGVEARYDLDADSIYLDKTYYSEKFPETIYGQFAKSCTISGAVFLFNKNISYIKYLRFLKGGSKHSQLTMLGISIAVAVGSICGFSQGSELGRNYKQQENALRLYRTLGYRSQWESAFEDNPYLKLIHKQNTISRAQNTIIWIYPDSAITIAKEHGLQRPCILLKYNEWEIGKHSYKKLEQVIKQSQDVKKEIVFMEIDSLKNVIKTMGLPKGLVGIIFERPTKYSDIQYEIQEYYSWKNENQSDSQI